MYKIAFLSFAWNYEAATQYYEGIKRYTDKHEDVEVFIFNGFGKYSGTSFEKGSLEIYTLANIKEYDGLIIQGNRSWPEEMRQEIVDQANELGIPCVSINYELPGSTYIGTDNYKALYDVTSFLLEDRMADDVVFVRGLKTSIEAAERERGFSDAVKEYGVRNARYFDASWQIEDGVAVARKLLMNRNHLPEVIVCCNDDLAFGVMTTLQKAGVRVPEEVRLTGFDNRDFALSATPRISTVDRDYNTVAYTGIEVLVKRLKGESVPDKVFSPCKLILAGSCGHNAESMTNAEIRKNYFNTASAMKSFYTVQDIIGPELLNADSLAEIMKLFEQYGNIFEVPNIYGVINKQYIESLENVEGVRHYASEMWLMSAYGYKGNRTADAENHLYEEFSTSELLPADILNQSRFHLFYPVRFNEICIGYIVMDDISFYAKVNFLSTILMVFENAIENARKKDLLQSMNEKLDDLYSRDPLTGLYNRFGMNKYGKQIYDDLIKNVGKAYFSFVDIDNMKYINDNFGHDQGDNAIVSVSEAIKKTCSEIEAFAMRYGGDEFIVISGTSIRDLIEKNLHEIEVQNGMEYPFTVSVGEYVVDRRDGISIEQGIENADDEMYMIKKTHKMSNGPAGKEVS